MHCCMEMARLSCMVSIERTADAMADRHEHAGIEPLHVATNGLWHVVDFVVGCWYSNPFEDDQNVYGISTCL